jgi:hypothetical protein
LKLPGTSGEQVCYTSNLFSLVREEFQVKSSVKKQLRNRKRRLQRRLRKRQWEDRQRRLFEDQNIHYDYTEKIRGGRFGGLGVCILLIQRLHLAGALDDGLHLLKRHLPYYESDHILNLTYNILAGGTTLADLELLRNNDTYLDALGVPCIPDPTTAGDFLRRFEAKDILTLMDVINDHRLLVWRQQPRTFFEHAILEADGTLAGTSGACKQGMDLSYKGVWGYHPLLVSLANTQEPLFLVNRPASRPSHEAAAPFLDQAIDLCREAGFRKITLRGDTAFSQTAYLDDWDGRNVGFVFGIDAMPNLVEKARSLAESDWQRLERPAAYEVKTEQRTRPEAVKEEVVRQKGYKNIRLLREDVAAFAYRPAACRKDYRVVVLPKNLVVEKHGKKEEDQVRYFFYITNQRDWSCAEVVYFANDRCNQENLIAQLKGGVGALRLPSNTLEANWAYMVIGALAWSIKAWLALLQPRQEHRESLLTTEFKQFFQKWLSLPCQIVRMGRRMIYRMVQWNDWVPVLLRTVDRLRQLQFT